jgi:hypothetical protein
MSGERFSLSGNKIHAGSLGLRRFKFLSNFDAVLIGLNRSSVRVFRFVCDESDFCLTNDSMGRVCRTYRAHVPSLLEFLQFAQGVVHGFLRGSVNIALSGYMGAYGGSEACMWSMPRLHRKATLSVGIIEKITFAIESSAAAPPSDPG